MECALRLLLCALLVVFAAGQGLKREKSGLSSSNNGARMLERQYEQQFKQSREVVKNYRSFNKAGCSGGQGKAALCASNIGGGSADSDAAILALGPTEFSWVNPPGGRGGDALAMINPFGPVRDQGRCSTCVSFAVVAAAEAAVARGLGLGGGSVRMSAQDLGFCPITDGDLRFCQVDWTFNSALNKLKTQSLVAEECLPYQVDKLFSDETKCAYQCTRPDSRAQSGRFNVRQIGSIAQAQRHLRRFGGVLSPLNIYSDFRPFFAANPSGVYDGKGCTGGADFVEGHAVVLVGYNNKEGYWVARNSWGQGFADGGYFKIKYGVCGLGNSGEMWGVTWIPNDGIKIPFAVSPDASKPGCFIYKAKPGDSISSLADTWGVDAFELLFNNSAEITDIGSTLAGLTLSVCGISNNNVDLKLPNWINQDVVTPTYQPTGQRASDRPKSSGSSAPASAPASAPSSAPRNSGGGGGGSGGGGGGLPIPFIGRRLAWLAPTKTQR